MELVSRRKILAYGIVILFSSCEESQEFQKQDLIEARVKKNLSDFRLGKLEQCQKNALLDARAYVDSARLVLIDNEKLNNIMTPEKTPRPDRPEFQKSEKNLEAVPLFNKDSIDNGDLEIN